MPSTWPVLRGALCDLRVLVEEDAPLWRTDEDDRQFVTREEFYASVELVAEAMRLGADWGLHNLKPEKVVAFLPDADHINERVLDAAGFRFDGPPAPWETGRTRFRFHPSER